MQYHLIPRYELAHHPEIQRRLQEEIDSTLEELACEVEELDYSTIQQLPYLDMVINESLRLHSPAGIIFRKCTRDYK